MSQDPQPDWFEPVDDREDVREDEVIFFTGSLDEYLEWRAGITPPLWVLQERATEQAEAYLESVFEDEGGSQ